MRAFAFTDRGGHRERNEDAVLCGEVIARQEMEAPEESQLPPGGFLGAVADGMGGGPGGAEAARIILSALAGAVLPGFWEEARELVQAVCRHAAEGLTRLAGGRPELAGLGTAVAGLWARGDRALAFNCGDCRVYRIRHGFFDLLTKDHSLVYELYASGALEEEAMAAHPLKHILTSSIQDSADPPRVFFREVPLIAGDSFFLCSDGVWEALPRAELERLASSGPPGESASLVARALKGLGARDNTSFLWIC
ncbi:MAG: serine/threonine-protein phosphatase [Deltaproteobacteria bacterium]|nr:serine/threonine-protein phosphatase [Deltaproteobacteria bacterium]